MDVLLPFNVRMHDARMRMNPVTRNDSRRTAM